MAGQSSFSGYGGPAGLIDRMIGEEYEVVKAVAEVLPDLPPILEAVNAVGGLVTLTDAANEAKEAAEESATSAAGSANLALEYRDTANDHKIAADQYRGLASGSATAAAGSATISGQHAASSLASANQSATSAGQADAHRIASAASSARAQEWATKTNGEVVVGQGYGAKKYATDSSNSSLSSAGSATVAEQARLLAVQAKNQAVEIATFDPTLYAQRSELRRMAKRASLIYGS